MGFFDFDGGSVISGRSSHSRRHSSHPKSSKRRDRSRSRSSSRKHQDKGFAASLFGGDNYQKHSSSRSSFFGQPNASRSSFFGFSRPSYYKRSPRGGFLHKAKKTVKRLWRDLMRLLKENPGKVVMLAVRMASGSFGGAGGGGQGAKVNIQRGMGNGMAWEKKTVEKDFGWGDTIGGMAKMFI
ncbi:Calcium-transporting ATPase 2 [Verticillium dahliae VDG1]|nr:Calcium-transporting ATPase 2 [Verticillium dahliae VDG1]